MFELQNITLFKWPKKHEHNWVWSYTIWECIECGKIALINPLTDPAGGDRIKP